MKKFWDKFDPEGNHLLLCFLTVLALTLFARGFAGAAQAQVTVSSPQSRAMTGKFQTFGTLTPMGTEQYAIPEGLVIEKTTQIGTSLEAGDVVALVAPGELDALLTRKGAEATQLELRIEGLLEDNAPSMDGVTTAKEAVSDAKDVRKECKEALTAAQEALDLAAEEEKSAAEAAVAEAEQLLYNAEEALSDAQAQLKREEAAYADAQTKARRERKSNQAEARVLQLDLEKVSAELAELESVRNAGYAVTAPAKGILAELEGNYFAMTNPYGGNLLTFSLEAEDADLLTARTKITVSREEQTVEMAGCTAKSEDGERTTFTAPMVKTGWEPGNVTVSGILWEELYDACVPIGALRRDANGYFLFVLERRANLWAVEQTVRKVYVYPERMDGVYAAVSGLEPGQQVVVTSSKPLTEGSRVRVMP